MKFENAMSSLREGKKIQRSGWNGKGMFLIYFSPVVFGIDTLLIEGVGKYPLRPFVLMKTADAQFVPWVASQSDILSDDWVELEGQSVTVLPISDDIGIEAIEASLMEKLKSDFSNEIEFINSEKERLQKLSNELAEKEKSFQQTMDASKAIDDTEEELLP